LLARGCKRFDCEVGSPGCYEQWVLRAELQSLFPASVTGAESELGAGTLEEPLFPEEAAYVARAVDKRKREFAAGRACARRALALLGVAPSPLLANEDRSVRWPDTTLGSITHTEGLCVAIAARSSELRGVGIDAEVRARVGARLWKQVASEREIAWFRAASSVHEAAERATLLFSAKEAFYKAQYCVSRCFVGFHAVELSFEESGRFHVTLQEDIASSFRQGASFEGRYVQLAAHVVTGVVLTVEDG
jgi:4'-phosphopantetheinyl transferase EntD